MNNAAANTPEGMVLITVEADEDFTKTVRELLAAKRTIRGLKAQAVELEQHEAQRRIARRAYAKEQLAEKNAEIEELKKQLAEAKMSN